MIILKYSKTNCNFFIPITIQLKRNILLGNPMRVSIQTVDASAERNGLRNDKRRNKPPPRVFNFGARWLGAINSQ